MLEETLESPLDSKELKPVNPKEINPEYSLEGLMQKLQCFGNLVGRADSLEKTIALTRQMFVGKVMSLLFNMLSRLAIDFLPRSKHLLIS